MKNSILALTIFAVFATSCGSSPEAPATTDSTAVAQDSMACDTTKCDTTCADSVKK